MPFYIRTWWRHQMETFSALLVICAGNSPVPGEFPTQRPVTRGFHVFFDLRLNKRLSKQSWGWWFETLSRPLWRHRNVKPSCVGNSEINTMRLELCRRKDFIGISMAPCVDTKQPSHIWGQLTIIQQGNHIENWLLHKMHYTIWRTTHNRHSLI